MTSPALEAAVAKAAEWKEMTTRVKEVLVDRLDLPIPSGWITDDQPLFGRGLELDSLDALELSMAVDQEFNMPMYEEDTASFGSVSAFLEFVLSKAETRAQEPAPTPNSGINMALAQMRDFKNAEGGIEGASLSTPPAQD